MSFPRPYTPSETTNILDQWSERNNDLVSNELNFYPGIITGQAVNFKRTLFVNVVQKWMRVSYWMWKDLSTGNRGNRRGEGGIRKSARRSTPSVWVNKQKCGRGRKELHRSASLASLDIWRWLAYLAIPLSPAGLEMIKRFRSVCDYVHFNNRQTRICQAIIWQNICKRMICIGEYNE